MTDPDRPRVGTHCEQQHVLLWAARVQSGNVEQNSLFQSPRDTLLGLQYVVRGQNMSVFSGPGCVLCVCLPRLNPFLVVLADIFLGNVLPGPGGWVPWEKTGFSGCVQTDFLSAGE